MSRLDKSDWTEPAGITQLAQAGGNNAVLNARFCPHGYECDCQVVQYTDGTLAWRLRNDFSTDRDPQLGPCPHECTLDLASVFESFRLECRKRRRHGIDPNRGRLATISLAVGDRYASIMCQPPIHGEPGDGSVIDQLWRLTEIRGKNSVTAGDGQRTIGDPQSPQATQSGTHRGNTLFDRMLRLFRR
jgi:hypothetical protein